jgi:hypothetical protein
MTPEQTKTADKMKSVKATWDKAPAGPKKDAALKHYQAAEKAHTAKNDAETNKELDASDPDRPDRTRQGPPARHSREMSQGRPGKSRARLREAAAGRGSRGRRSDPARRQDGTASADSHNLPCFRSRPAPASSPTPAENAPCGRPHRAVLFRRDARRPWPRPVTPPRGSPSPSGVSANAWRRSLASTSAAWISTMGSKL